MKRGIALLFISEVRGGYWPRAIEVKNIFNCLAVRYRAIVELDEVDNLRDVISKYLVLRHPRPMEWFASNPISLEKEPPAKTTVWHPELPDRLARPELIFHRFGDYTNGETTYTLIAVEVSNVEVGLYDQPVIIGGPSAPEELFEQEPTFIRDLLITGWQEHFS